VREASKTIIEFHTHIYQGKRRVGDLTHPMGKNGIDITGISTLLWSADQCSEDATQFVHLTVEDRPNRLAGFATGNPFERCRF
jgi:hypothetical protein